MLYLCQSGHPEGSLSCVEILMSLYYKAVNVEAVNPTMENRDRIILSKGHTCPALYAILADKGCFPREDLWSLRQIDGHLQGHPDMIKTPGIDVNTALLIKVHLLLLVWLLQQNTKKADYKVYVIIGDGEVQEGLIWEA